MVSRYVVTIICFEIRNGLYCYFVNENPICRAEYLMPNDAY